MRIGLFTDTYVPEVNGVVTVIRMMTRELRNAGHEVFIFCPSYPGADTDEPGVYRLSSIRFVFYKGMRMAIPFSRAITRLIPTLDIIHSHDPGPIGLMALWASLRYRKPHIHTYHTLFMDYRRYLPWVIRPTSHMVRLMSRQFCNRCEGVIAPSVQMRKELESYGISSPIHTLPFGVNADDFSHEISWDVRENLNIPTKDLLLFVGRLGREKNLLFLLRAFRRLLAYRPTARLIIAGDGPMRQPLEREAAEMGILSAITFIGFVERHKLVDLYKQALFVFPSKTETQGLVLVEAMMAGAAAVAVGVMGPKDIISSGRTGLLVNEDENEFAQACLLLLTDDDLRQRIGAAAHDWAHTQTAQVSTEKLLEIYSQAVKQSPRHVRRFSLL